MMTLFINACVRNTSRTKELADCLFAKQNSPYEALRLAAIEFPIANEKLFGFFTFFMLFSVDILL